MSEEQKYISSFDEYIREGQPDQQKSAVNWQTAIGLQAVDGLKPSNYLLNIAHKNIEGEISLEESRRLINSYYTMGFNVDNKMFALHSWYFRNALVRANYRNIQKGIEYSPIYLVRFFRNLLLGEKWDLRNRYLHINASRKQSEQNETTD